MEINVSKVAPYLRRGGRTEVAVKEGSTEIKFDLNNRDEIKGFCHHLLDTAFAEMEMDEIVSYLTEHGYSDEIIERYEDEKTEAA